MKTHKLMPGGFGVIKKNLIKKYLGTSLAIVVTAPVAAVWGLGMKPFTTLTLVAVLILLSLISYFRSIKIQRIGIDSYELTLGEDFISRRQAELTEIEITRDQVAGIHETVGSGLLVVTEDCYKYIFIPSILESYDEVKDELRRWKVIEIMPVRTFPVLKIFISSIVAASFMTTVLARSTWLYIASGIILNLILAVTLYVLSKNHNVEQQARRQRLVSYLLVLSLSILGLRILSQVGVW